MRFHSLLLVALLAWASDASAQVVRFPSIEIGTVSVGCRYQSLDVSDDNPNGDVTGSVCDQVNEASSGIIWTKTSGAATTSGWVALTTSSSTGTVTSVALTAPGIFSVAGSPITTSGTLARSLANQNAKTFLGGPTSGGATTPAFRQLQLSDIAQSSAASGQVPKWDGSAWAPADDAGAASGAPTAAQYLVLALDATLTNERLLDCGVGLTCNDGGANADFDVEIDGAVAARKFGITVDGSGSTITTGVKGFALVPMTGTITSATLLSTDASATACSIVFDVWVDDPNGGADYPPTNADSITASAPPTLSTDNYSRDSTLTGWTTAVTVDHVVGFNVDSVTACTRVTLILTVEP